MLFFGIEPKFAAHASFFIKCNIFERILDVSNNIIRCALIA